MEKERPFLVYPVRKPTILREKKELPRDHHQFLFFCLFIINLAALLKIYQSNQYLNKLTVITQNFRSDIDKLAIHHRLLLTKLQQLVRQFNFKDVVKTFNTTSDGTWGIPSVCNWKELETGLSYSASKDDVGVCFLNHWGLFFSSFVVRNAMVQLL